jgi:hypothetical protein
MTVRLIAAVLLFGFWNSCFAFDAPQYSSEWANDGTRIVGMECHKKKQTLELGYFTPNNIPDKRMDLWDTFDLKENTEDGGSVKTVHEVVRRCNIGTDRYVVKVRPVLGNWNLNGECGGNTAGGAKVFKNGVLVFDSNFEECGSEEVTVKVYFSSAIEKPEITKVSKHEFVFGKDVPR